MHARFWVLALLPLMISTATATDIYKCTAKNGVVSYADRPCPSQQATLLHKETEAEAAQAKQDRITMTLNGMIDSGHIDEARSFAAANGASAYFQQRILDNVRRDQIKRQQEIANDAEMRRANAAADQARHQQTMDEMQAKLVEADTAQEKFRKEHWSEIKQQHEGEALQMQSNVVFNPARNQWCSVGKDGSTVCKDKP